MTEPLADDTLVVGPILAHVLGVARRGRHQLDRHSQRCWPGRVGAVGARRRARASGDAGAGAHARLAQSLTPGARPGALEALEAVASPQSRDHQAGRARRDRGVSGGDPVHSQPLQAGPPDLLEITSLDLSEGVAGETYAEYIPNHVCSSKTVLSQGVPQRGVPVAPAPAGGPCRGEASLKARRHLRREENHAQKHRHDGPAHRRHRPDGALVLRGALLGDLAPVRSLAAASRELRGAGRAGRTPASSASTTGASPRLLARDAGVGAEGRYCFTPAPVWNPIATCTVKAQPDDDFFGWDGFSTDGASIRWYILFRYPLGVRLNEGRGLVRQRARPGGVQAAGAHAFLQLQVRAGGRSRCPACGTRRHAAAKTA